MNKTVSILLIVILFFYSNIFSGIAYNTLVSTPNGLIPVQHLRVGDTVIGYCFKCKKCIESPITKIKKKTEKHFISIQVGEENLCVSKKHIFFDPVKQGWVRAINLTCRNYFMSYSFVDSNLILSKIRHYSARKVKRRIILYEISLESPHTFFISKSQILNHNFACSLGLGLAFGSGLISFETLTVAFSCVGFMLYNRFSKKSKFNTHVVYNPCNHNHSPNKKPDDNKKKKERKKNKMTKTEFFQSVKKEYKFWKRAGGKKIYQKIKGQKGLGKKVEYIYWDSLHGEVEAFSKSEAHLGAYDPATKLLYKPAVPGRLFPGR